MGMGTASVNATAAEIADALDSLYWVNVNRSLVIDKLTVEVLSHIFQLGGLTMSPEAIAKWEAQFLTLQLSQR